jgi:prevent-host-death family protein
MSALLRDLDELPQQNATQVKNKWGDVVRQVQQEGSVAITNHATVEMVMIAANTYRQMTALMEEIRERERKVKLDELERRFDERLAVLQQPDARDRLDAMFASRGKFKKQRPIAGETY